MNDCEAHGQVVVLARGDAAVGDGTYPRAVAADDAPARIGQPWIDAHDDM